ncbi:hypothetical protein WA026_001021, partial [Henosepilachna vigintioctopunctata]
MDSFPLLSIEDSWQVDELDVQIFAQRTKSAIIVGIEEQTRHGRTRPLEHRGDD